MAQFGSALDWGSRGRRFKSCRPDQKSKRESNRSPVFYEGRQPAQQAWTSSIGFEPKGSPKCYQALLARGSRLKSEAAFIQVKANHYVVASQTLTCMANVLISTLVTRANFCVPTRNLNGRAIALPFFMRDDSLRSRHGLCHLLKYAFQNSRVFFYLDFSTMNTAFSPGDRRFCSCQSTSQKFVLESG